MERVVTLKLKKGYMLKKVMGSFMIISTEDDGVNQMQTLNETGAFLWNLLEEDTTIDEMVNAMIKEYDVDADTAKADIEAFICKIENSNMLEK